MEIRKYACGVTALAALVFLVITFFSLVNDTGYQIQLGIFTIACAEVSNSFYDPAQWVKE